MEKVQAYKAKDGSLFISERDCKIKDVSINLRSFLIHKSSLFEFTDNGLVNPSIAIEALTHAIVNNRDEFLKIIEL